MIEGIKHDDDKLRMDLIPPEAMNALAEVLTIGAVKYGDRNWEKGIAWSRVFGATMRHIWSWFARQDLDQETRLSHLKHAFCNLAFLVTYEERHEGQDDRSTFPVIRDNGYYCRSGLVQRFNGILDTFIFKARPAGDTGKDDVSDFCNSL